MSLIDEYRRQAEWRDWPAIFGLLPRLAGQTVLDLGCGIGDQAAELLARGAARVIGLDVSDDLLAAARVRLLAGAEFRKADITSLDGLDLCADGIWASFSAAYFPDLTPVLESWRRQLRSGGWIALTEIDDMFGHAPLEPDVKALLDGYARNALADSRYDFHMGRKLSGHLAAAGFTIRRTLTVGDAELSFDGPARPDVVEAWRARFDRMVLLQRFCGAEFPRVREGFLGCLRRSDHRSQAKVYCCLASWSREVRRQGVTVGARAVRLGEGGARRTRHRGAWGPRCP